MDSTLLPWLVAALIGIGTPLLGYFSPFGRVRRALVADLQKEVDVLTQKVERLNEEMRRLEVKQEECERDRARLERENYRLYRELDGRVG